MSDNKPEGKIVRTESDAYGVVLTLDNGVTVRVAANNGYLHLNFAGISSGPGLACTPMSHLGQIPTQELWVSNYVNIFYPTR